MCPMISHHWIFYSDSWVFSSLCPLVCWLISFSDTLGGPNVPGCPQILQLAEYWWEQKLCFVAAFAYVMLSYHPCCYLLVVVVDASLFCVQLVLLAWLLYGDIFAFTLMFPWGHNASRNGLADRIPVLYELWMCLHLCFYVVKRHPVTKNKF